MKQGSDQTAYSPTPVGMGVNQDDLIDTLYALGARQKDIGAAETRVLRDLLQPDEVLIGVVYGRYRRDNGPSLGRGMLAATEDRVLFIDSKPMFLHYDEIIYDIVGGITYAHVGFASTVTVDTSMGNFSFRTFNRTGAMNFVHAVEKKLFQKKRGDNQILKKFGGDE